MFNAIKSLFTPKLETPEMRVARELYEARMDILKAQKEREYWHSMVTMLNQRIGRLQGYHDTDSNSQ